jgi:hypothetical protein
MQLIQAIAKSAPRQVNTRYGQKTVIDATGQNGEDITIWRGGDDRSPALNSITNGSRISVGRDSKGKYSLLETPGDRAAQVAQRTEISPSVDPQPARPMGFAVALPMEAERQLSRQLSAAQTNQGVPVTDYGNSPVTALGHLFQECLAVADGLVGEGDRVRVALALFDRLPQS